MDYSWIIENASTLASAAGVLVSAVYGGLRHLRAIVRTEVQDFAPSKQDVAKMDAKLDLLLAERNAPQAGLRQPAA